MFLLCLHLGLLLTKPLLRSCVLKSLLEVGALLCMRRVFAIVKIYF